MSHRDRLQILIVSPSLPYPPSWGFGIRVYEIIRQLGKLHDVSLLTYAGAQDNDRIAALEAVGAEVHVVRGGKTAGVTKRGGQLVSLLSWKSFQRQLFYSKQMQAAIDQLTGAKQFDVIQLESSQMNGFDFPAAPRLVVDEHNIEYELLHRTYKTERSPLRKLYNWVEFQKFRREEQQSWHIADGVVVTSDREEKILRIHAPHKPRCVVPNGVDIEYFQNGTNVSDPNSIVFVGLMHYRPNVDAALYFVRDVLPHILRKRPGAIFTIVGGGAPEQLRRLAGPNVVLTDAVPDTRPYVSRAGAFVVPLRMGSGTRLKVLEGLAMSRPLVSTSLGCEGIDAQDGQHLLIADDPITFAQRVLQVLNDDQLAAQLGRNGRALVEQRYSWPSVLRRLEDFLYTVRGEGKVAEADEAGAVPVR
jgi:polysaccharide biosynthesis protein PslH